MSGDNVSAGSEALPHSHPSAYIDLIRLWPSWYRPSWSSLRMSNCRF